MTHMPDFRELLERPMNRRQFLTYIGAVALGLLGIKSLLRTVTDPHGVRPSSQQRGYSSGSYGGK